MMKWEDITDEARKATEQALTDLLTENRKISGDQLSIRLQDPAYLEKKSQQRKRYCGEEAFRQMKRRQGTAGSRKSVYGSGLPVRHAF